MKKKVFAFLASCLMLGTVLCSAGCGGGGGADGPVRYIIYTTGGNMDDSYRVFAKVDDYVYEKLGFHVEIEGYGYDNYEQRLGLMLDAREDFDMCFSGSILSGLSYSSTAAKGYFADLTDLLDRYAPKLRASMAETIWDAARVNGKLYGVANEQILARSTGIAVRKEIAEALSDRFTQEKIREEGIGWDTFVREVMAYIKGNPDLAPNGRVPSTSLVIGDVWTDLLMPYEKLDALGSSSYYPGIIDATAEHPTVFNQYESDYFKQFADFCREMYEEGYLDRDAVNNPITTNQLVRSCGSYMPGAEADLYNSVGKEFVQFQFGDPMVSTYNSTTSMTCVYALSKKAEKCVQLMELLATDEYLYNLMAYGEEGIDYRWKDALDPASGETYRYISTIPTSKYKLNTSWGFGKETLSYRRYLQPADVHEKTKEINRTADASVANGFTFIVPSAMQVNVDNCYRIANNYITRYLNGTYDADKTNAEIIKQMNDEMKDYVQPIIEEKQRQLDAFLAAK